MRTFVIGDIHSGLKALKELLEKAKVTTNDHLIFLGDYIDGWSDAAETIDFLIALKTTHKCTFIRGNHDELCHDWLSEGKDNPTWFMHGGEATIQSYDKTSADTKKAHIKFYKELENYYIDAKNRIFLHAGFTNLKGVEFEYFTQSFYWDRTLWELALALNPAITPEDTFYPARLKQYKEIYIGHTPLTRIGETYPKNIANLWNMDTGAAFKGPLSIMDIDTKEIWQSEPVHTFYPGERGRN